jgi:hypothetical protein
MGEEAGELSLPDEGSLIEWIMWPYPTARLRARQRRDCHVQSLLEDPDGRWHRGQEAKRDR